METIYRQGGKFRKKLVLRRIFSRFEAWPGEDFALSRLLCLIVSYVIAKHGVFNASPFLF